MKSSSSKFGNDTFITFEMPRVSYRRLVGKMNISLLFRPSVIRGPWTEHHCDVMLRRQGSIRDMCAIKTSLILLFFWVISSQQQNCTPLVLSSGFFLSIAKFPVRVFYKKIYRKVASSRPVYYSILNFFGQRTQYTPSKKNLLSHLYWGTQWTIKIS